ncbi:MAG: hypothetical protein MSG64_15660 [Pyrinomonadaceae bacterium MAG19_C2-C3]|nr:hypothetical protein [Pyrinomonadaceae bacterium MAG19_C2-C3]
MNKLFSLQGQVYMARRDPDTGLHGALLDIGNATKATLGMTREKIDHKESTSGNRTVDHQLTKEQKIEFAITLDHLKQENIRVIVAGENRPTVAGGAIVDEFIAGSALAGDFLKLGSPNATLITLENNNVALAAGTNYEVVDAAFGLIRVLTDMAGPVTASYTRAALKATTVMTDEGAEYFIYYAGLNTIAKPYKKIGIEIYRVQIEPAKAFDLIHEEYGSFELTGAALSDPNREDDPDFGAFARILDISSSL